MCLQQIWQVLGSKALFSACFLELAGWPKSSVRSKCKTHFWPMGSSELRCCPTLAPLPLLADARTRQKGPQFPAPPKVPFQTPQIPSNGDHKALHRGTLGFVSCPMVSRGRPHHGERALDILCTAAAQSFSNQARRDQKSSSEGPATSSLT